MSFYLQYEGPATEVIDKVRAHTPYDDNPQLNVVKDFIETHLSRFPGLNHVTVTASGHHDGPTGNVNIVIGHTAATPPETPPDQPAPV